MTINFTRASATRVATVVMTICLAIGALGGCSDPAPREGGDRPIPTSTARPIDPTALGTALERLVYAGQPPTTNEMTRSQSGKCLTEAVRTAGLSPVAQALIVDRGEAKLLSDWGATVVAVRAKVGAADADVMLSSKLRAGVDACVQAALGVEGKSLDVPEVSPPWERQKPGKPNLTPSRTLRPNEEITMLSQLEPGLVTMLSSFVDEQHGRELKVAGPCLAEAVMNAGFTQDTLRFFAGGAPLGIGSVVDHLATAEDKSLWASPAHVATMSLCLRRT